MFREFSGRPSRTLWFVRPHERSYHSRASIGISSRQPAPAGTEDGASSADMMITRRYGRNPPARQVSTRTPGTGSWERRETATKRRSDGATKGRRVRLGLPVHRVGSFEGLAGFDLGLFSRTSRVSMAPAGIRGFVPSTFFSPRRLFPPQTRILVVRTSAHRTSRVIAGGSGAGERLGLGNAEEGRMRDKADRGRRTGVW